MSNTWHVISLIQSPICKIQVVLFLFTPIFVHLFRIVNYRQHQTMCRQHLAQVAPKELCSY